MIQTIAHERSIIFKIIDDIKELYLTDPSPWIIGYSGGKDSTTVLQLVYYALLELPVDKLNKQIHVICNDTLVENPAINSFVNERLAIIKEKGKTELYRHNPALFNVVKSTPKMEDRFWVNLIGNGYPSPNRWFRWCVDRLKINPTNEYCKKITENSGNVIIVLGTRTSESANRSASMKHYDTGGRLRQHSMPNAFVYAPIATLSDNDVWAYLLQVPSPWGNNKDVLRLYNNSCVGGECPFVIETGTQSCGKSRFGCWICTVVDRDKSMENFIDNGEIWMEGLLEFRNWLLTIRQENNQYVPVRLKGKVKFSGLLMKTRKEIFRKLLILQKQLNIQLIDSEEQAIVEKLLSRITPTKKNKIQRYIYRLPNEQRLAVISDYDIQQSERKRIGSIHIKNLKKIRVENVPESYSASARIMYYTVGS